MSTIHIPSRSITTCDSCGVVLGYENCRRRITLKIRHTGSEAAGRDAPKEDRSMDLCDACGHAIGVAVDKQVIACAAAMTCTWPDAQPTPAEDA